MGVCSTRAQNRTDALTMAIGQKENGANARGKTAPDADSARNFCPLARLIYATASEVVLANFQKIDLALIAIDNLKIEVLNACGLANLGEMAEGMHD